jgi:hypothetical protein
MGQLNTHHVVTLYEKEPFGFAVSIGVYEEYGHMSAGEFVSSYFYADSNDSFKRDAIRGLLVEQQERDGTRYESIVGLQNRSGMFGRAAWITHGRDAVFFISRASARISGQKDRNDFDEMLKTLRFTD